MTHLGEFQSNGDLEHGLKQIEFGLCGGSHGFELGLKDDDPKAAVISDAVKVLLLGLGEDSNREGLRKTPLRVAKALLEGTRGYSQDVNDVVEGALFPEAGLDGGVGHAGGAGGLVIVRDIDLFSFCESCLLPFKIQCHVGYIPSGHRVVGLSKLSRVADVFAKRLQDPQRLAHQVCSALQDSINPAGVAVALQCWHIQFPAEESSHMHNTQVGMRGWDPVSVCSGSGLLENRNSGAWSDFLALSKFRFSNTEMTTHCWCSSRSQEVPVCTGHGIKNHLLQNSIFSSPDKLGSAEPSMIAAVASILISLGEDPSRKELMGTPYRFVQWLTKFKKSTDADMKLNVFDYCSLDLVKKRWGDGSHDENWMGYELNLPFLSQCEHHLLPFHGVAHIAYLFGGEKCSVDKHCLQSIVGFHGCKLQVQERLTRQIAETVSCVFEGIEGVMVVVEANHVCMISRGIKKVGSSTATIALLGRFASDHAVRSMFLRTVSESSHFS